MNPTQGVLPELDQWYFEGLQLFRDRIEKAIENKGDIGEFQEILAWGFKTFDLKPKDLEVSLDISKSAISKWVNGNSATTWPTQRSVLEWALERVAVQLAEYQPSIAPAM